MGFIMQRGTTSAKELAQQLAKVREEQQQTEPVAQQTNAEGDDAALCIAKEAVHKEQLSPLEAMRKRMAERSAKQDQQAIETNAAKLLAPATSAAPEPAKLSLKERMALLRKQGAQPNEKPTTIPSAMEVEAKKPTSESVRVEKNATQTSSTEAPKPDTVTILQEKASTSSLQARLAALKNKGSKQSTDVSGAQVPTITNQLGVRGSSQVQEITEANEVAANRAVVQLNAKQLEAVELAKSLLLGDPRQGRRGMVLIGKAGTGKTTSVREIIKWLLLPKDKGGYGIERTADFKRQNGSGTKDRIDNQPRIVVGSFTKKAVVNIKNSCIQSTPELKEAEWCFQSIHNALEYAPEYYDDYNEKGEAVTKMRFSPQKWAGDKIDCDVLIIEEASMVGLDLWAKVIEALPEHCIVIFLGDIAQLPPVFGMPILIYAMHHLPVVELDFVYRTKMGPVLRGAHSILDGQIPKWEEEADKGALNLYVPVRKAGRTTLASITKLTPDAEEISVGEAKLAAIYEKLFEALYAKGDYDPDQDIILSPYNVNDLGTINLNKGIAQFLGSKRNAEVFEILAGWEKHYLAVGDKVMVDKQDGRITAIRFNANYMGSMPQPSGTDLTRYGTRIIGAAGKGTDAHADLDLDDYANFSLEKLAEISEEDAAKQAASHIVEVELETGEIITLDRKGSFNSDKFTLGYCLTGHKSQGSEWRNVYIVMHKAHHTNLNREWLYTCMTRTRVNCTILANQYSVEKAIKTQRITGNSVAEKLAWFTKDCTDLDEVKVCPGS